MNTPARRQFTRVLLAALLPFAACLLQWVLWDAFKPLVWFLFYPTIFFSSRLGGLLGGLLATAISALLAAYIFMPPQFSFVFENPKHLYAVTVFLIMGVLFSLTHEGLRKAQERIQRLYEQTRQLDELKSQLFANVSHELRTPLTLILGPVSRQLARKDLPEEERRDLQVVERNAQLLYRHVSDLLDVAKVEAKKMGMHYSREDVGRIIRFVTSHFEVLATEKRIRFTVQAADGVLAQVDAEKIQRVLFNLLSNAFKFTPDGGAISISMRPDRSHASILISDNGPGIPLNMRTAIFERFRQVEGGVMRRHGGTGLGLAITKEFVQLHYGTIEVTDNPEGGGTCFVVTLPLSAPAGSEIHTRAGALDEQIERQLVDELRLKPQGQTTFKSSANDNAPLVLVVEDNPDMNAFLVQTLGQKYRVATATNGQEGLEKALALRPGLILSDVMMPGMSGDQLVVALRARPEIANIPIVILTAKADDELKVKLLEQHVQDYLCKPFSEAELLARVARIVAENQRTDEELRDSESMLLGILEAVNESVFLMEPDGKVLFQNATATRRLGKAPGEVLGRCTYDFLSPELAQTRREQVARVLQTGHPVQFEDVRGEINFENTVYPVFDAQGKVIRLAVFGRDVTARKLAAEALRKSGLLLNETQEITKVGGWEYEISTGHVSWTDQVYQIYGVGRDFDLRDVTQAMSLYEPESLPALRSAFERAVKHAESYDLELKLIRANGEMIWVRTLGKPVKEGGKVVRVMGNIMDITSRKRTEALLATRLKLSDLAVDTSLDQLMQVALDEAELLTGSRIGFFHFVDADQENLTLQAWSTNTQKNMCRAEGIGQHYAISKAGVWMDCFRAKAPVIHNDYASLVHKKGMPEGHAPVIRELTVPIFRGGLVVAILGVGNKPTDYIREDIEVVQSFANIVMDVVDRKRLEAERQRLYEQARQDVRIRAELLDEVNHRVKNNLVSIMGVIEMEKQESERSGRSAISLLDGLKGRIGGMLAVHEMLNKSYWAPLELGELVGRILEGAASGSEIRDRIGVELVFYPEERRAQKIIPLQATALALILNELVTNSIKYAFVGRSYGRIKIDMVFLAVNNVPDMLTLIYRDDGHGWPLEVLAETREGVGLRLIRGTLRSLPQGKMVLQNEGGAMATINFKLTPTT